MQTSPPLPAVDRGGKASKRSSKDVSNDDTISVLDPRRFTPTLHANLVAEILNLRRDQEDKIKLIENLEASLHATRGEQEALQETATVTAKETRSLKRQLALLEGGSSSAIGELARERDEAVESATELKKRLDVAQRKIRTQEDDSQRVHDLWTRDKDAWDEEKRKYERKIHIAETRMKVVLDEVAAYQNAHTNGNGAESEAEETGRETDAASIRTMSMTNSIRFSTQQSPGKTNTGNCLADELNLDGDDDWHTDDGGRESVLSHHRHTRNMSRDSVVSRMHRRNQSIESLKRPGSVARGKLWVNQTVLEALEDGIQEDEDEEEAPPAPKLAYKDTGVQFSPPPSPTREVFKPATPEPLTQVERPPEGDSQRHAELEIEANQRRKRVQLARPLSIEPPYRLQESMVSAGSQTAEEPLSPPKTPKSPFRSMTPPSPEIETVPMVSASTQTEKEDEPEPLQRLPEFAPLRELSIPSISVIPPTSRPSTPREPRLPLYNKDAACQVSLLSSPVASKSIGVQTEEIRIDQRLARLPLHLHPDTISSRPPSPNPAAPANAGDPSLVQFTPAPNNLPPRNPRRLTSRRSIGDVPPSPPLPAPPISPTFSGGLSNGLENTHNDAYPGNNDDGPLSSQKAPMRRPHRISSLFAGFDANSSDEADDFGDGDLSDPEFQTALSHPGQRPKSNLNSIGGGSPTTGVVDAIAQTMVGEWMFKYVRRRKSFGVPETNGKDDNSNDRHKRWVWLAPYERAILWSSKQPNSGSALMGKAGRKLTIQSVLDVKDDNPTPKGGATLFNRSILILTPQRALKFTAVSADRHYIWLTALSFLAHSQQAVPEIITAPPPPKTVLPDFEMPQPKRKTGIRDSIRLTKSKAPSFRQPPVPSIPGSLPSAPSSQVGDVSSSRQTETFPPLPMSSHHQREQSSDAAEPPFIPRFHERSSQAMVHGRKRSNTGGHVPPPLSFRGFSGPAAGHSYTDSNAGNSVGTAGSSDIYQSHRSQASSGGPSWGLSTAGSQRTSEASSRPSNFFDAIGTVRMEAFISPLAFSGGFDGDPDENDEFRYRARRRSKEMRRRSSRSRHRERQNSRSTRSTNDYYGGSKTAGEEDFFRDDPFKGF
ncbi:hypothetical protein ACHAO3_006482 [Verticillium nonalfalfae]